ncbi:MAG TPA: type III-B CRISPR module RAMP protein Cmr1 [Haliangiales bacterium]|nr:type III-B CRISPR module RAMP protein Cmr1 [Haliangiales bacterium]
MKTLYYTLRFLTPCFCAGANQTRGELRATALRGQLRWWFRVLGGNAEQEARVFGATAGGTGSASAVQLRVRILEEGPRWRPVDMGSMDNRGAYIWYFASKSADGKRWWKTPPGRRNQPPGIFNHEGHLPPGTRFELSIRFLRSLPQSESAKLDEAIEALLRFGGVRMRLSRGLGAWVCDQFDAALPATQAAAERLLRKNGVTIKFGNTGFEDAEAAVFDAEARLRFDLREQYNANNQPNTPLGGVSQNPKVRQTSAVYFRPFATSDGFGLLVFEVPHSLVLSMAARRAAAGPVIAQRTFTGSPPAAPPRQRRRY